MDRELRDRWIAALESGTYAKGKYQLRSEAYGDEAPVFCCLGVLCEIDGAEPTGSSFVTTDNISKNDQHTLAKLNDNSDTFEDVVVRIRELFPDKALS